MPPSQPPPQSNLIRDYYFARGLTQYPALALMVFLRRDLGYRLVNPLALTLTFGALAVLAILAAPGNEAYRPWDVVLFAVVGFVLGMVQRIKGWWRVNRNDPSHSYYLGTSPFAFRWLPGFVLRNRRINRFVDPLFCAAIGITLLEYSRFLAYWIIFSAFCLRYFEYAVWRRWRQRTLDLGDGMVETGNQTRVVEHFQEGPDRRRQPSSGLPTGLGPDVKEHMQRGKRK